MKIINVILTCIFSIQYGIICNAQPVSSHPTLDYYFNSPASAWNEAIPIGNGRLGGMVFGGVEQEIIQTNDDTFWSGEPRDLQKPGSYKGLVEIRKLLDEGKTEEAQAIINKVMLGPWNQNYLPLCDILLDMSKGKYTGYRRSLNLSKGTINITYQQNGVTYNREIFVSYPDQAIVIRLTADKSKHINLTTDLRSMVRYHTHAENGQLIIDGQAPKHTEPNYVGKIDPVYENGHGMRFEGRLMIRETDGTIKAEAGKLMLNDASYATLIFVVATNFNGFDKDPYKEGKDEKLLCQRYEENISHKSYGTLYDRHIKDFSSLFDRVDINLGSSSASHAPIDERIKSYKPGSDPSLTALYLQFGRYLLISSSRPGSQPANLQGIWNNQLQPAWSSNWTLNCNAEINYWPAEVTNLSECHLPFINMIQEASVDGMRTARNLYNCRGWIAHHNLDIWRTTWPVGGSGSWAIYQVGSAWMCQHIWQHYLFTKDKFFLKKFYPLLRGASLFYMDNLQTDKDGFLVTNPSISFENNFKRQDGVTGWACIGSAQDMQIIRSLFANTMKAMKILGKDSALCDSLQKSYNRLAPMRISPTTGMLQEWNEDIDAADPHNGQVAQGWGLIESDLISLHRTPALAKAFRKTIEYRKPWLSYNSGSWTGAFPSEFWARLGEGDSTQVVIDRHFQKALFPNLTCQFFNSWQIDGNLGVCAAIASMLVQSDENEIDILPALPSQYKTGYVRGLKAQGGCTVDIYWRDGKLQKTIIKSEFQNKIRVRYKNKIKAITLKPGESRSVF